MSEKPISNQVIQSPPVTQHLHLVPHFFERNQLVDVRIIGWRASCANSGSASNERHNVAMNFIVQFLISAFDWVHYMLTGPHGH